MSGSFQYNITCEKHLQGKPSCISKQNYTLTFLSQYLQCCVVKEAKAYVISFYSTSQKTNFCIYRSIGVLTSRVEMRSHTLCMHCSLASFLLAGLAVQSFNVCECPLRSSYRTLVFHLLWTLCQ